MGMPYMSIVDNRVEEVNVLLLDLTGYAERIFWAGK